MTRHTQRDFFRLLFRHKNFDRFLNMLTMIGSASCCPSHRLPLRLPGRIRRRRSRPTGTGPSFACRNRMSEIYVEWKSPEKYGEVSLRAPREMLTFCCRSPRGSPCSTRSRAGPASPLLRRLRSRRRRRRCTSTWTRRCPSCLLAERRSRSVCSGGGAAAE